MMNDKSKGKETCLRFLDLGPPLAQTRDSGRARLYPQRTKHRTPVGKGRGLFFHDKDRRLLPNPS